MKMIGKALCVTALAVVVAGDCSVDDASKVDCGYTGIDESECENKGCCWAESGTSGVPWCFYASGAGETNCFAQYNGSSLEAPFSESERETMLEYFIANIDVNGTGAVCAAPDTATPGGSYFYHWERDGALTMRALQKVSKQREDAAMKVEHYAEWVVARDAMSDPNGIDVRTEPKYEIPSGDAYTGGWCRPQNDGPGLRALTLIKAAKDGLLDADFIQSTLWTSDGSNQGGAIKYNLDYVSDGGYQTSTCDLWEEVTSTDFFWNRVTARAAMYAGAKFAVDYDSSAAQKYAATADAINASLFQDHWSSGKNGYLIEATDREIDGAVLVALANFVPADDPLLGPATLAVAQTVAAYNRAFCDEYPINLQDTAAGLPGVLVGRYPGDTYAGGNPWVLITAALAHLLYRAPAASVQDATLAPDALAAWQDALPGLGDNAQPDDFLRAGDAVLIRLRSHVQADGFRLDEQIDKYFGNQTSAKSLTWSYAETLLALDARDQLASSLHHHKHYSQKQQITESFATS